MINRFKFGHTSKYKIAKLIDEQYGGRYTRRESFSMKNGVGIGGVKYVSGSRFLDRYHEERDTLGMNFERLKDGLAVYFRNLEHNVIYLLNFEDIVHFKLVKEPDIIAPKKKKLFEWLLDRGMDYYFAKIMLIDDSIIAETKTEISLTLSNEEELILRQFRQSPKPIARFFDSLLSDGKDIRVEDFLYGE